MIRRWMGKPPERRASAEERARRKYGDFRSLLAANNECLSLLTSLQEDLSYVPPLPAVVGERAAGVFLRASSSVEALERVTGRSFPSFHRLLEAGRREVEAFVAAEGYRETPPLALSLSRLDASRVAEAGGKAATLGEVANGVGLPVPDGFVLTTAAYWQTVGLPLWSRIRDTLRDLDPGDEKALAEASRRLREAVLALSLPRAVEVALTERAKALARGRGGLAVRSSAVGEGGRRTFAGQFLSLLNVPEADLPKAYLQVLASRFSERAIAYRLAQGIREVESPLAVLVLPTIQARAAGILYTRDPGRPASGNLLVTATAGLALDLAGGKAPGDLFVVSRSRSHPVLERRTLDKPERVVPSPGGGLARERVPEEEQRKPALSTEELQILAHWGVRLEAHFGVPQDVEWVLDETGDLYVVQSRDLLVGKERTALRGRPKAVPLLSGGRTVFPGRASGKAVVEGEGGRLGPVPEGTVLVVRRPTPEIVRILPRLNGVVAEEGNVTGHAAALLREYGIPALFEARGALRLVQNGDAVSLDAARRTLYGGLLWPPADRTVEIAERFAPEKSDPLHRRLLTLHLGDPSAFNFRPGACRSAHDVLRYCHEKAIEAMFSLSDTVLDRSPEAARRLVAATPIRLFVLDLGGGVRVTESPPGEIRPEEIVSRPFRALWRGVNHPGVSWRREMPASLSGLASVMAGSLSAQSGVRRALGEKSYLLVAENHMNLNSRLAFHFTLVDACLDDEPNANYISFRFAGGGATRWRRNLRAIFLERVLRSLGFEADRRMDVVNAWHRKGSAEATDRALDLLGRLMACSSQLDMYMESEESMEWYVEQFLRGNYRFENPQGGPPAGEGVPAAGP